MFEKLNQLVKENADKEVFLNAGIAESSLEAVANDASGVIFDVLRSELDNGRVKDLMSFFRSKKSEQNTVVKMMINKYCNRLNKYYGISNAAAKEVSLQVIPAVMKDFVALTGENVKEEEKGIFAMLNWLSGNTVNFENFFSRMEDIQIA